MNLDQRISISRGHRRESTTFLFRYGEIHELDYGSSTDLEVKASAGRAAATCRLEVELSPDRLRGHWTLGT